MGIFTKFFSKKDKSKNAAEIAVAEKKASVFQQKIDQVTSGAKGLIQRAKDEIEIIKHKLDNLLETNYKLGLKHIERGNISDAIFRFKFIKKFWPFCYDAYYQLAYVYMLDRRPYRAKEVLHELIEKCPDYTTKANELLRQIEDSEKNTQS